MSRVSPIGAISCGARCVAPGSLVRGRGGEIIGVFGKAECAPGPRSVDGLRLSLSRKEVGMRKWHWKSCFELGQLN